MKKHLSLCLFAMMTIAAIAQYPQRVYLCGPGTPSGWSTNQNPMFTNVDDTNEPTGTYEWIGDLNTGEMKLLYGTSWEPGYASEVDGEELTIGTHNVVDRPTSDDPDYKWAATAGRYKLVLDLTTMTLTVSDATAILEDKNGDSQEFYVPEPLSIYPIGDATLYGWKTSLSEPIDEVANKPGVYDGLVFLKAGEFKLLHQADFAGFQYGPVEDKEAIVGAGEYTLCRPKKDHKWIVSSDLEEYKAFHMIVDAAAGKLVLRDTAVSIPPCTTLYMCGDAVGGWDFANAIELTSSDSVFHFKGNLLDGEFKFFEKKNFDSQAWGANEDGTPVTSSGEFDLVKLTADNKFYMTAGFYDITADLKNGTMTVVYSISSGLENVKAEKTVKKITNGQVIILRNGEAYTVLGAKL